MVHREHPDAPLYATLPQEDLGLEDLAKGQYDGVAYVSSGAIVAAEDHSGISPCSALPNLHGREIHPFSKY